MGWVSSVALARVFDTRSRHQTPLYPLNDARQRGHGRRNVSGAVCRLRFGFGGVRPQWAGVCGNGESPPAGVRAGSLCAPRWRCGCVGLVHAGGHDDYLGGAVAAGGGVVVGLCGAAVGVGDVVGGAGEAVELVGCHAVGGGAWFFWCCK